MIDRIQQLCKEQKITLTALERELGLGKSTIRKWDANAPSIDKVAKVADYFKVSVDYLLGRVDDPDYEIRTDLHESLKKIGYENITMLANSELTEEDIQELIQFAIKVKGDRKSDR